MPKSPEVSRLPGRRSLDRPAGDDLPADRKVRHRLVGLDRQPTVGRLYPHGHLAVRPVRNRGHVAARRSRGAPTGPSNAPPSIASKPELAEPGTARQRGERGEGHQTPRAEPTPRGRAADQGHAGDTDAASSASAASGAGFGTRGDSTSPATPRARAAKRRRSPVVAGSGLEPGAQSVHGRRPDAVDLVELVDRRDAAVLVAVIDDVLRGDRTDPLDRVELLDGRGAEADRPSSRRSNLRSTRPRRRRRSSSIVSVPRLVARRQGGRPG